ncbi:branched-chain amino acid ABC transporter permease [Trujillonella endophytica]|uniref:Branched-chain amino acid transport system permease protein n=1 Tax=Trujillonella endophytica TaxID=673521 RepID=A0A1H8W247_9ACTN|nr:branched-chain amino acid ABC transporter permease [Trujillella endophytica]SEP21690.1 branched-chain amino acid transport system permease protein [Trujillella endophytica]
MSETQTPTGDPGAASDAAPTTATAGANAPSAGAGGRRSLLPRITLLRHLLVLVVGAAVAVLLLESTELNTNIKLGNVAYLAIAAGGLTLLTGLSGQISLGHGALMAVGAYTTALMLDVERSEEPPSLALVFLAAVAATTLVGALVGVAAARLHGPYLAGATLALAVGLPGLALYFSDTFNGEQGLTIRPPERPEWFTETVEQLSGATGRGLNDKWVAYIAVACLLISYFFLANLMRSRMGRTWRAVRDQEVAAELAGISLGAWRVLAFVVSAAAAGLAGAVLAIVVQLAAPGSFLPVLSLSLLTAVVIGGLGTLTGALLGSALLVFLPPWLIDLGRDVFDMEEAQASQSSFVVYGLLLVVTMLFAPAGLVGTIRLALLRRRAARALTRSGRG